MRLLNTTEAQNRMFLHHEICEAVRYLARDKHTATLGIIGVGFKPGSSSAKGSCFRDVIRDILHPSSENTIFSVSIWDDLETTQELIRGLQPSGFTNDRVSRASSATDIVEKSDVIIVGNMHAHTFRQYGFLELLKGHKNVIDPRKILDGTTFPIDRS